MRQQTTPYVLMVRPANFGFNEETAQSNAFQKNSGTQTAEQIKNLALAEFDALVAALTKQGVKVFVGDDTAHPVKPDAVFPNNWVTFHQEGFYVTYPMFSPKRRRERRRQIISRLLESGFTAKNRMNFEYNEKLNLFLEGTGSIVFDHLHQLAYACLSERTNEKLLDELCKLIGYQKVIFTATDEKGKEIYHTNVMMAMGETFVVICRDSVKNSDEKALLKAKFAETGKEIVEISMAQMNSFAGNMLQVRNIDGKTILAMSETAYTSLTKKQVEMLEKHTAILYSPIPTIETYGGGSVRCMIAEIFLPRG